MFKESNTFTFDDLPNITHFRMGQNFADGYKPCKTKSIPKIIGTTNTKFDENHPFINKTMVFMGTLQSMVRNEAAQKVIDVGGKFDKSINKSTSFLIVGNQDLSRFKDGIKSSKMKKVEQLKLKVSK
ncbi:BRCT domain-containing protein [Lysinibacillus sp. Ag94]|uniref:BRCT domain-containing protein n=1 Tax=Lysinibacillus sp. Ag94 TaxID=2936682 RepID=UPI00200C8371|nr:BRCT domain-containing protein [Lysinibacillus sp. Ag94]UPW85387.1 hypothetical protein MY533_09845 [Lysinibacillus sp. Ag94]